ncbi:MAG: hypothetical protein NWT08_01790 [Akkermansiaceae bacterium]|jgi:hypothetical protein|nr:hypothetical protein [Akkermansiaceae bacterium]MDP4721018.1 hypothetical protein [Akkermansiaceae bacterium]MDP4781635.1 hypothetical protein [Akkermansiaceae bacterium]MDP4847931.1 hypothetical protein [Akkermansiaceae bacterium]MDP4897670.1 hypothetical protein [Akkermansiaceae bacterium]
MKLRFILIALAVLFASIGSIFIFSGQDPAPRDSWQTYAGALKSVTFTDASKMGRRMVIQLDNEDEPAFALSYLNKYPGLEESINALKPDAMVKIDAVPREQAGWAAPEGEPLTILVLRHEQETIYDRDHYDEGRGFLRIIFQVFGYLGILVAALLAFLAFRVGKGRS